MGRCVEALTDPRDPRSLDHRSEEVWRQRILQSRCGSEEANDGQTLRSEPALQVAGDRGPIVG
jgi:hypothetical protein